MKLTEEMAEVLDLETETSDGNVAAHVWRLAYATDSDGFAGINLGWVDMEDSTDFLTGIVDAVEDAFQAGRDVDVDLPTIADSTVPVYTGERMRVLSELSLSAEPVSDMGLLGEDPSAVDIAGLVLYETAEEIASALVVALSKL